MNKNIHSTHGASTNSSLRNKLVKGKACTIWFTGLSGAGKTTLAYGVEYLLLKNGYNCFVLDGDNIRRGLCNNLSFSEIDRSENIRRVAEVAKIMNEAGLFVMVALISPLINDRKIAREIVGDGFKEVFVDVDLVECEKRDPKGLYKKARRGEIRDFTGIFSVYEIPAISELIVKNNNINPEDAIGIVWDYLVARVILDN